MILDRHLGKVFCESVDQFGPRAAMRFKNQGQWEELSYEQMGEKVRILASAMVRSGLAPGDRVAIYSANCYQWAVTDFACIMAGLVSVPIYSTNTKAQADYILSDSGATLVFTGDQTQLDNVADVCGDDVKIISFNEEEAILSEGRTLGFSAFLDSGRDADCDDTLQRRRCELTSEHTLTIVYTSGTTGNPKGVMLSHGNILHQFRAIDRHFDVSCEDVSLCFLPLSHVYERLWSYYLYSKGALNTYLSDPKKVIETLKEIRPTAMVSVPRLYEKIHAAVLNAQENSSWIKKRLFAAALKTGRDYNTRKSHSQKISPVLALKFRVLDKLVLSKVRDLVGGPKNFFSAGGAPLEQSIEEFFFSCGLLICQGYGLTETSPMISFNCPGAFRFGTVGKPLPDCEVKLSEEGEVMVRGGQVMKGYFNSPEKTAKSIVDGWFKTGDIGMFDRDGFLKITDRLKELIITSGGKNIAPQRIETLVGKDYFIEQIVAIGDKKKFISALVVPAMEALENWAEEKGLTWSSVEELINRKEVLALYRKRIDLNSSALAKFETIKKFTLLPRPFTVEEGEITPTLKLKRKKISEKYFALIESMYQKADA